MSLFVCLFVCLFACLFICLLCLLCVFRVCVGGGGKFAWGRAEFRRSTTPLAASGFASILYMVEIQLPRVFLNHARMSNAIFIGNNCFL